MRRLQAVVSPPGSCRPASAEVKGCASPKLAWPWLSVCARVDQVRCASTSSPWAAEKNWALATGVPASSVSVSCQERGSAASKGPSSRALSSTR
jgi:proteasome lid subunit RPN8/RPN11